MELRRITMGVGDQAPCSFSFPTIYGLGGPISVTRWTQAVQASVAMSARSPQDQARTLAKLVQHRQHPWGYDRSNHMINEFRHRHMVGIWGQFLQGSDQGFTHRMAFTYGQTIEVRVRCFPWARHQRIPNSFLTSANLASVFWFRVGWRAAQYSSTACFR